MSGIQIERTLGLPDASRRPRLRLVAAGERAIPWASLEKCVAHLGDLDEADRQCVRRLMRTSGFRDVGDVRRVAEIAGRLQPGRMF